MQDGYRARSLRRCGELGRGRLSACWNIEHPRRAFIIGKEGDDYGFDRFALVDDSA